MLSLSKHDLLALIPSPFDRLRVKTKIPLLYPPLPEGRNFNFAPGKVPLQANS